MKITESARNAILKVMRSQDLNPQQWYLEFAILENGAIGVGFTQEPGAQMLEFGELRLVMSESIDSEGFKVDYKETGTRRCLTFGEDKGCDNPNCQCDGNCGENCQCQKE